uniref:Putative zinc-dependent protease n=1 Tax=uncultured Acidobacteriota bacterium TaxID=171953 RepID=Q7X2Z3_9BACT|nr:putative zinc-dependent protease [uncultured Acidobacteriota bacterium]
MGNIDSNTIGQFILYMVALIFSLSVHESAHAWMSNRFGDDLARLQGRISLNPAVHVDPIGTLLFPAIAFFTHLPIIGWAKPTPVNPLKWRNKRVANFWVSAAGVISNAFIAIVAGVLMRVLYEVNVVQLYMSPYYGLGAEATGGSIIAEGGAKLLSGFFTLNIALAIFNLIPVPPLDGSKILASILPSSFDEALETLERFGFLLLMVLMFTGVFNFIFRVIMPLVSYPFIIGLG